LLKWIIRQRPPLAYFKDRGPFRPRISTRTGVALLEYRYDVPFKFTGKIDKLTFNLEPKKDTNAKR
jgi:hypothetical protein